jgi:hypothetical protein
MVHTYYHLIFADSGAFSIMIDDTYTFNGMTSTPIDTRYVGKCRFYIYDSEPNVFFETVRAVHVFYVCLDVL